jgi:hypothetical protein
MTTDRMDSGDPMRTGGALWCGEHQRWECTRDSKRSKTRCHARAISGLDRCYAHAGESTDVAKARGRANLEAAAFGHGDDFANPTDVMLWAVTVAWMRARLLAQLLEGEYTRSGVRALVAWSERGEQVSALATLEGRERDRALEASTKAIAAGIAEREVRLAEAHGDLLHGVISRILGALDLSPEQAARVPLVVPAELRALVGGGQ